MQDYGSLSDGVDVTFVGRVDLAIVAQEQECLVKDIRAHLLLNDVPDVTLVDELVCLSDFSHDLEDELSGVTVRIAEAITTGIVCDCTASADGTGLSLLLSSECTVRKNTLLTDAVSGENLKEMVCHFVHLFNFLDVSANDGLFFAEDADGAVDFDVRV